jgi:hypothetical protein
MIEIELFPKVNNRSEHSVQGLDRLLKWTSSNAVLMHNTSAYRQFLNNNPDATPKEKSDKKLHYFPAVTFSGTFSNSGKAEDILKMSGLIVLDFDHLDNLPAIYQQLKNDNLTYLLFISPSNDGLKLVVKHNLKDPKKWQDLYYELEDSYLKRFELQADKSGKDINRMCFLPFMDNLYKNDNSVTWEYLDKGNFENNNHGRKDSIVRELPLDTQDDLVKECQFIAQYFSENFIDITDNYADWLSYGYSLCALGESGREIYHAISSISGKYDPDDCDKHYDYMLDHYDPEKNGINNYLNNGKRAIAHYLILNKYGFMCK